MNWMARACLPTCWAISPSKCSGFGVIRLGGENPPVNLLGHVELVLPDGVQTAIANASEIVAIACIVAIQRADHNVFPKNGLPVGILVH